MIERMCRSCGRTFPQYSTVQTICQTCAFNKYAKPRKAIKRAGKHAKLWLQAREEWFRVNVSPFYTCYICGSTLSPSETTLDHIKPRGSSPQLRYTQSNLAPCCWTCNGKKGSQSLEKYKESLTT